MYPRLAVFRGNLPSKASLTFDPTVLTFDSIDYYELLNTSINEFNLLFIFNTTENPWLIQ